MATYDAAQQLSLPLVAAKRKPEIADSVEIVHQRRPDLRKLPADFTDAELLTQVLGPQPCLSASS